MKEVDPQFLKWEEEERQFRQEEQLKKIQQIKEEDGVEGLPAYMLALLEEFQEEIEMRYKEEIVAFES